MAGLLRKQVFCIFLLVLLLARSSVAIVEARDKIEIVKNRAGEYQLLVKKQLYFIKGVCYQPIPIGYTYNYNFWGDKNKPHLKDGVMMKTLGINTVRFYQPGENIWQTKQVITDLFKIFEIRTIMGHWLNWWEADYANPDFQRAVTKDVLQMVRTYKDTPGILMWVLGNENNYSFGPQKINYWTSPELEKIKDPYEKKMALAKIYYSFVNKLAKLIKRIDPQHPVVLGNGDLGTISQAAKYCPNVDIFGSICYRGKSFGNFFREVAREFKKPVILLEFGCDAYDAYKQKEDQETQASFLRTQWKEIAINACGGGGYGNCFGGFMFEWCDEWWKYEGGDWQIHDAEATWSNGAYYQDIRASRNMNMNEEWWGIVALDTNCIKGLNVRQPRQAYFLLQKMFGMKKTK